MTQQEFMERTGITPTAEDFDYIHAVYLNTSMNKDEFCKDFKKHGDSRIIRDVHVRVLNYEMKCERQKEVIDNLTDFLIGKAHAYDDTDFRKEAVGLVGEMEVVKRTIELGLPLWDEDRMVVLSMIEETRQIDCRITGSPERRAGAAGTAGELVNRNKKA